MRSITAMGADAQKGALEVANGSGDSFKDMLRGHDEARHSTFARMLRNKAAIAVTSGLIVSAAFLSLTGCGSENSFKIVTVDWSQVGKQNDITLTPEYAKVLLDNGLSKEVIDRTQGLQAAAIKDHAAFIVYSGRNVIVFYDSTPKEVPAPYYVAFGGIILPSEFDPGIQEYQFFNNSQINDANTAQKIEDSIQKSLPNLKLESPNPASLAGFAELQRNGNWSPNPIEIVGAILIGGGVLFGIICGIIYSSGGGGGGGNSGGGGSRDTPHTDLGPNWGAWIGGPRDVNGNQLPGGGGAQPGEWKEP